MSGTNSSNSSNQMAVPQAKEAMHRFKQELSLIHISEPTRR